VGIGHSTFQLVGDRLEEFVDQGEITFTARELTVRVRHRGEQKTLLDGVSLTLPVKSLVAVVGPSGSGKSTLLRALTGYRPADQGDVLYDGRNLYTDFAELRQRIGLVPQDDILHAQLTVRTALRYAARLRFPGTPWRPSATAGWTRYWRSWGSATGPTTGSPPCPAASASGSPWRWNC
jgi:ABC-type multidrug transport system ATPase subunit